MNTTIFTEQDIAQLEQRGITLKEARQQLQHLKEGFPDLDIVAPATISNQGVRRLTVAQQDHYVQLWQDYVKQGHSIAKFVPASGAASRMFKDLYAYLNDPAQDNEPTSAAVREFLASIDRFAFAPLLKDKHGKEAVRCLLEENRYGQLPKGLLLFHTYKDGARTPAAEHLAEGAMVMGQDGQTVKVHFTVSHEHLPLFRQYIAQILPDLQRKYNVQYDVTFSEQSPSTDTIAANADGTPFRNADGTLLFRPGGHGALIENLAKIDADIIFIKNIDNIVPDRLKRKIVHWKQVIAGVLVEEMQKGIHQRPIRVCGVVRNTGEPGGGPFLVKEQDGSISRQILESSQIKDKSLLEHSKFFNPVDLVCSTRDAQGQTYQLRDFVDENTGFISEKSKDGKELKALELPGLWNGAMSKWETVFVEVPISTFNPVKTVNDLLRKQHQPK